MSLEFTKHEKISLRKHPTLNERWLQDRIVEDPSLLGLGELRVLDRERISQGGGRLDLLLSDDESDRRYEVEIQLGPTDPSHIIRCIEYWDLERRRYPGYDHVAVLIAEDVTARFLNIISLMAGSIPIMAIQLDALAVEDKLLLNFIQVLDQTEMRIDDTDASNGGGEADRAYWEKKAGKELMKLCETTLDLINERTKVPRELNFRKGYIGLQLDGISNNFIYWAPKSSRRYTHIGFRNSESKTWVERFEEAGVPVRTQKRGRLRISVTPEEFASHRGLITELISETVAEHDG